MESDAEAIIESRISQAAAEIAGIMDEYPRPLTDFTWRKIARETVAALRRAADEIERQIGGDDGK